jgi:hypothetical protein
MIDILVALKAVKHHGKEPEVLKGADPNERYNEVRQVFNRRFNHKPAYIVLVESAEQVSNAVKVANEYDYPLRVCAGRHDHEGENSATGAIVIDFRKMTHWEVKDHSNNKKCVHVQPGVRFQDIVAKMADDYDRSIPHGTCQSVGVAGFTLGGGWGPWTRKHGMCCEYLVGATIVLGDGEIVRITDDEKDKNRDLLWALRGGGGFSYGIVTEFVIETFESPKEAIKFKVIWETTPAIDVLKRWEDITDPNQGDGNPKLVGTNLQIDAVPANSMAVEESIHTCIFYGYYVGDAPTYDAMCEELRGDLGNWFDGLMPTTLNIPEKHENDKISFSTWERRPPKNVNSIRKGLLGAEFPADEDAPAPHKITSRLVVKEGLGDEGRKRLINSLRSDLLSVDGQAAGIHTYVTLGAIWGPFYKSYNRLDHPLGSAFPYKERPYTIQYQCWWDESEEDKAHGKMYHVHRYVNRALDWIDQSRQRAFPQTKGAFISFKDSSVPTREYFCESYDRLVRIKMAYSRDVNNVFSTRKTII